MFSFRSLLAIIWYLLDLSTDPLLFVVYALLANVLTWSVPSLLHPNIHRNHWPLFKGINFYTSLIRLRFEESSQNLFRKALEKAKIDKSNVHEIVLIGGSTCITRIVKFLSENLR